MFNIFSTIKDNASQAFGTAKSAVGGAINTANQNLQEFGGDVYDTYSSAKNTLKNTYDSGYNKLYNAGGNAYDTYANTKNIVTNKVQKANQKLQDFGGDVYDVYAGGQDARKNILSKNIAGPTGNVAYDFGADIVNTNPVTKIVRGFGDFATGVGEVSKERDATKYGISQSDIDFVVDDLLKQGYKDEDIIASVQAFDAQEMARKQQEFAQKYNPSQASIPRKALAGAINFGGGMVAGGMRLPAGVIDFASVGSSAYARDTMSAINEFSDASAGAKAGDIFGNIATTALIPTARLGATAIKGAPILSSVANGVKIGGAFGALDPIMQKGSEATFGDITKGAGIGATVGGVLPLAVPAVRGAVNLGARGIEKSGAIAQDVGTLATAPLKSTISAIKRYAGSPEEIAGTQYAIGAKSVLRNGRNLRPQKQITEEIGIANGLIRSAGKKPTDIASYREAIKDEMEKIGREISRLTNQDLTIDMSPIANKLRQKAMSDTVQTLDEEGARKLLALADKYDRKIPIREAEDMNQFINAMLRNKDITVNESVKQGLQDIVVGIRSGLDSSISQIPGQFRDLKKAYGSLRNVYGDVTAKEIVINRKALSGLYESFSAIEGFGDIVGGLGKIVTGSPGAGFSDIAKGFTKNKVGEFITRKNDPNEVIKKVFSKSGKSRAMPDIQKKQIKLLPAPKANAKQSEILAPIKGSKSAAELSRESMQGIKPSIIKNTSQQSESPFKNNKGFISPKEISESAKKAGEKLKSIIPKKDTAPEEFYRDLVKAGNSPIVAQRETAKRFGALRSLSASNAGTMEIPVKRASDEVLYHGSSSIRELKDFDLDISMQKAKQGSGIGGSFAEGPGIYLTSSKAEASGYGPKVSEFSVKGANIIEKNGTKSLSRQEVSNLLSKIDKDTLQRAIDDWGSKNDLIDNIMEQGNTYEQLMDVWASVFSQQNPKGFVNAVKGIGIDALKVPKEGTTHYVIYNPDKFVSSPNPISPQKTAKK